MEASIITSLGTCKLVIPLSESTIAISGPLAKHFSISASISERLFSSSSEILFKTLPKPLLAFTPNCSKVSACLSKTSAKKTFTACPNMMGSDTFIMVAFKCNENKTPCCFASLICSAKKARKALTLIREESITSPACNGVLCFKTVSPSAVFKTILTSSSASITTDCSLE